jgi:hypothetical protein
MKRAVRRSKKIAVVFCVALVGLAGACADWDAAVGVPCKDYPAFCRTTSGDGDAASDAGTPAEEGGTPDASGSDGSVAPMTVLFGRDIRPLMDRTETDPSGPGCSACHYTTTGDQLGITDGQMDLTTLGTLRRGGKTSAGKIIVPGNADASALVQKLRGTYPVGSRMPWNGPPYWKDSEIQLVVTWINEGARGSDDE